MSLLEQPTPTDEVVRGAGGPLDHLDPVDRRRFVEFGWGRSAEPSATLLHRGFEAQVRDRPDAPAVEHGDLVVSYRELDRQAEVVAAELRARGVGRGDHVCLFAQRSIPLVAAMLGVLKTGAAYVPQDAAVAPPSQLRHIAARTAAPVVLTLSHLQNRLPRFEGAEVLDLDVLVGGPPPADQEIAGTLRVPSRFSGRTELVTKSRVAGPKNLAVGAAAADAMAGEADRSASPDDPCFVLFTSGTTGPPNGVVVTHRNVANVVLTEPGNLGIEPGMRVGQILSISFDMAEWEIHGALCHGATLVIRLDDIESTVAGVDVVIATPSILASLDPDRCHRVRVVAVAGEPCPDPLARTWSRFARFHNSCGPTETTIVNTVQHFDRTRDLTIGGPTPNNTVYVLDDDLRPLPIGEIGEMWAGGDCVTAGYLGNDLRTDELNRDRYRPDPFLGDGRKMFRTRDLGRWTPGGELEHFGRTDDQVKVRGFRIELDSVSSVLEARPRCTRAVTLKYDERHLVAFVEPATVDPGRAAAAIGEALPYYCVPVRIFAMAELPRTDRGKIDKAALRLLAEDSLGIIDGAIDAASPEAVAPGGEVRSR